MDCVKVHVSYTVISQHLKELSFVYVYIYIQNISLEYDKCQLHN